MPIMCVNGAKDHGISLKSVCDLAEFLRANPNLDWCTVREHARLIGRENMLLLGLALTSELLEVELPSPVKSWVEADPRVRTMSLQICQWLLHSSSQPLSAWLKISFNLRWRDSVRDKAQYGFFALIQQLDRSVTRWMVSKV